jgi:hypothetical protein
VERSGRVTGHYPVICMEGLRKALSPKIKLQSGHPAFRSRFEARASQLQGLERYLYCSFVYCDSLNSHLLMPHYHLSITSDTTRTPKLKYWRVNDARSVKFMKAITIILRTECFRNDGRCSELGPTESATGTR